MLAFGQFLVSSNPKEHRFHLTVSHFYQFRNLRSRDIRCFVSFSFFYSTRASSLLKYRSSLPVQISKNPAYLISVSYLVSFCFFYPLNCCSSLPVKICKKTSIPRQFSQNFFVDLLYTLVGDFYSSLGLNFLYLFIYVRSGQRRRHCNSFGQFLFLIFIGSIASTQLSFISKSSYL